jgi:predicted dehydrogenase
MALRLGLVGAGRRAAEVHALAWAESPDVDFVGVWTRRAAAAEALGHRYAVRPFASFQDLLAGCDAVSFAVPPAVQSELASAAARLGKHVLLEVPIAWDIAGAEELTEAVAASHVISQVAFTWRYTQSVRSFLRVDVPRINPTGARGRVIQAEHDPREETGQWRHERGLLFERGPHVVEFLDAALGPIVEVDAFGDRSGSVDLRLEHSLGRSSESFLNASAAVDYDHVEFEFFTENGSTFVDCSASRALADYGTMFAEFANAVSTETQHELDVRRGLHVQRVIEAAETQLLRGS